MDALTEIDLGKLCEGDGNLTERAEASQFELLNVLGQVRDTEGREEERGGEGTEDDLSR